MTRARRSVTVALCAGLAVSPVGQMGGNLNVRQGVATQELNTRVAAAQVLLSVREAAVRGKDKDAWMATVHEPASAFGRRQSVAFDNLIKLPLAQFSYGAARPAAMQRATRVGTSAWVATVPGTYSLAGFDRGQRSFGSTFTVVKKAGQWRFAADRDGPTALQMWDLPGLRVLRGKHGIVIGNAPEAHMRAYTALADSGVRRVEAVWGMNWNTHVVLVTPSTTEQFSQLLSGSDDAPEGNAINQIAAVTQGSIDSGQRSKGDRILINPNTFSALQPSGRQVVITHELTHVAVRSSTAKPVPIWLSEGLADYVGYSGLQLRRERVTSELMDLVRQGREPNALPTVADFDPALTSVSPSYSEAWLAVTRLVDLYGQAKLVAFYREIGGGPSQDKSVLGNFDALPGALSGDGVLAVLSAERSPDALAAQWFPKYFGVTEAQFVEDWKTYVRILARGRP